MAQIPYRANLSAAIFPMTIAKGGRTVINPQYDQNFDKRIDPVGDTSKSSVGIPQVLYMQNVFPTPDGFQSINMIFQDTIPNGGGVTINCVIGIKLATVSSNTEVTEDISITDTGDTIENWSIPGLFNFQLANPFDGSSYPSLGESDQGSLESDFIIYYREVAESSAEGSPSVNSYRLSSIINNGDSSPFNYTASLLRTLAVESSPLIEFDFRVRFKEGELFDRTLVALETFTFNKKMDVAIANTAAMAGLRITYSSITGNLAIASSDGSQAQNVTPTPIFSVALTVAYDTWYRFEVTVTRNEDDTRTVEVIAKDAGGSTLTTLTGIVAATVADGSRCGFLHTNVIDFSTVDFPGDSARYAVAPDKVYYDEISIQAEIGDEVFIVNSGIVNLYLAFMSDDTVSGSYTLTTWGDETVDLPVGFESPLSEDKVSVALVRGVAYVCIKQVDDSTKIYSVTTPLDVITFTDVTTTIDTGLLEGYSIDDVVGIADSFNYLILLTAARVFWSSTTTPTDFEASLISGAGSEIPGDLAGDIVFAKRHVSGFYIYTKGNAVFAQYTGNARYPWKFREVAGSGGYLKSTQVSGNTNTQTQLGITTSKLIQELGPDSASGIAPEVTDYLERGNFFDLFNDTTNVFTSEVSSGLGLDVSPGSVTIWFMLDKYIIVPYAKQIEAGDIPIFSYGIVYDLQLKRYGKIALTYSTVLTDDEAIYFVNYSTGHINKLNFDIHSQDSEAVSCILLGKFQFSRNNFIQLEEIEVEVSQSEEEFGSPPNFIVRLYPTLDGKTFLTPITPTEINATTELLRSYRTHTTAKNFSLMIKGAFDISTVQLVFNVHGSY